MSRDVVGNFFNFMNRTHLAEIFAKERAPCCADSALANTARNRQKKCGFCCKKCRFCCKKCRPLLAFKENVNKSRFIGVLHKPKRPTTFCVKFLIGYIAYTKI